MKSTLILSLIALSFNVQANVYGKFKLEIKPGHYDDQEVIFLLNSQGGIKFIENEYYYEFESLPFFGELTLNFRSGGDEDFMLGSFTLISDNDVVKSVASCATLISAPAQYMERRGKSAIRLFQWNKMKKEYQRVSWGSKEASDKCFTQYTRRYPDFRVF